MVSDQSNFDLKEHNKSITSRRNLDNFVVESAYNACNFKKIPPIIGFIVADQYGNTIIVIEYNSFNKDNFFPIKSYLSENEKTFLEIDLISMYFSSLKAFAGQTNIQNLSNLEIHGSNLKVQIFFLVDNYMIIVFLNSNTELSLKDKNRIIKYFEDKLIKFKFEFKHFNAAKSRKILGIVSSKGNGWLKQLNKNYLQMYKNSYLKKLDIIEDLRKEIGPIIEKVLHEYLENIPEDFLNNISKEIQNKIQDKLFRFNPNSQINKK